MQFFENTIVDYLGRNEMCLAVVVKTGTDRLQVKGVGEQLNRINVKQVLTNHGTAPANPLTKLASLQAEINDAMSEIDVPLLWEEAREQGDKVNFAELATTYFGETTPIQMSAMARKLLEDNLHFKIQQLQATPRTKEEIDEVIRLRNVRAEKAALREKTKSWLKEALAQRGDQLLPVPPEQETFIRQSTDYLLCGFAAEAVNLLSEVHSKMNAREVAVKLLQATGRMPEGADEFLLVNGIHAGFTAQVLTHADELAAKTASTAAEASAATAKNAVPTFSIDDQETCEIDDALACQRQADGYVVWIHIADPARLVQKDDCIDEAAMERPLSLYLPTTTVTMFPDQIGSNAGSLIENQPRPALTFIIEFNDQGELQDWSLATTTVTVAQRLTYQQANLLMRDGKCSTAEALRNLQMLTEKLRSQRAAAGAVNLNRPELKIRVRDGEVSVTPDQQDTPSHLLVSECMILANHLAARYALRHDIPVIYRAQEPPAEQVVALTTYEPHLFDQQVKKMKRTRLSTHPQPHYGLGLDAYTQISSPLRRYADLVIHRQLAAHLRGQQLPYAIEELFAILDRVDRTAARNRALEREANRYWLLEYLRRHHLKKTMPATVVRVEGSFLLAELDTFLERGVLMCRETVQVGQRLSARIREVHPDTARMVLEAESML